MNRIIKADLYRHNKSAGFFGFLKGLLIPGFRYIYVFRKINQSRKYSPSWFFFYLLKRRYSFKYGFQIPYRTKIGEGLFIGHHGALVINGDAIIGKNCNIGHNVTIGQTNRGKNMGCPTINDMVWIGAGAVIVGKINVGSNVLIAPNSYVNIDIPDNSIAIGNPCKIISHPNPCENYINFILK